MEIDDFIEFLFGYVSEQDLQHFDTEKYEELADLIAGTIIDFFGGYAKIMGW